MGTGGYRYSTPPDPPVLPLPRVHPPPSRQYSVASTVQYRGLNSVVGLRSVDQLSLDGQISGFRGMTEVYNLIVAGIINNH